MIWRAALVWLAMTMAASAQWLVYELRFTPEEDSVNFSFYTGAYVLASVHGGAATMILTTEEGGRFYAVSENGAKFFIAANKRTKKAVFSAAALTGSAQAFYSAAGYLNRSLLLDSPSGARSWRVAEELTGRLMASDDEAGLAPAPDGSLGMVGNARIKGKLREDLTANATANYATQAEATRYIIDLLEKYGYVPDKGEEPEPEPKPNAEAADTVIEPSLFPVESRPTELE